MPEAEVVHLGVVLPAYRGADGESAVREIGQLEAALRHLVGAPRDGRRSVDEGMAAEEMTAVTRSGGDPPVA